MSDYDRDRGAYTPSGDAPLSFDARQPTGGGRPPTTLIISALILLVLVVALVLYYRSGVRRAGAPPVVGQPMSDIRQAPPASAQPRDEAAGLAVYGAEQGQAQSATPTFEPSPEEPLPRAQPKARTSAAPASSTPTPLRVLTPAPQPTAAPKAPVVAEVTTTPKRPAAPTLASAPASPAGSGASLVQIGAFSSPALADKGWNDVARLVPGAMIGRTKKVEPVSAGAGTLYRAYVGGFASKAEAMSFCGELKAASHACIVK